MGSFRISSTANSISVIVEGMFTVDDARFYELCFKKEAAKVDPAKCHLSLDGSNLSIAPKEMQEILKNILALYKSMGFYDVSMNLGNNADLKMQIKHLAADTGFTKFSIA